MGEETGISWTDRTWSPFMGCTKVSAGCANCYAEKGSKRNPGVLGVWGPRGSRVVAAEASWEKVRRWDRQARERGGRIRVFPSICDPFEDWGGPMVDAKGTPIRAEGEFGRYRHIARPDGLASMDSVRVRFLQLIEETPSIDWLVLTKRAREMADWLKWYVMQEAGPLPRNLWGGVSVEDQAAASERIPHLLATPLAVRFVSMEPLLSGVSLRSYLKQPWMPDRIVRPHSVPVEYMDVVGVDWVIVGGESGKDARPVNAAWVRSLRDQCVAAGVKFHFKQWGEWLPGDQVNANGNQMAGLAWHDFKDGNQSLRVGKAIAGRTLDGRTWDEVPAGKAVAHA